MRHLVCVILAGIALLKIAQALSRVYDETAWTRQAFSSKLPFPARLVLLSGNNDAGQSISSQTGPYDTSLYRIEEGEAVRYVVWQLLYTAPTT